MIDIKDELKIIPMIEVLDLLGHRLKHGDQGDCPTGHGSTGGKCFSIDTRRNFYHCFNCGIGGDTISLVEVVKGIPFVDSLKWLAENFRPELLPMVERTREPTPEEKERQQKGTLYDLIFEHGKDLLYDGTGKDELDYLVHKRGYQVENLRKTEWIYIPKENDIREHLLSLHPEANQDLKTRIQNLPIFGHRWDSFSRLAFPYRDRNGRITGFMFRATTDRQDGMRYDSTTGLTKSDLFNLHSCRGKKDLVIVEGYPDALYLPTLGLDNVVAIGQGAFSKTYLEGLQAFGVRNVTIAFDNDHKKDNGTDEDPPGIANTRKAIPILQDAGFNVYILNPLIMFPHKDPDEYVRENGVEAFRSLLNKAVRGSTWITHQIILRHDLNTPKGSDTALEEAVGYISTIQGSRETREAQKIVRDHLNIDEMELSDRIQRYSDRRREDEQRKGYKDLSRGIGELIEAGKPFQDIQSYVTEKTIELRGKAGIKVIEPYPFDDLVKDIRSTQEGLKTGYSSLDRYLSIQAGTVNVIAGRPSHGKTTFMMNILLKMVEAYGDKSFFFFSYEEQRQKIGVKLINILSGDTIHPETNTHDLWNYLKGRNTNRPKVEAGKKQYSEYVNEGRLFIVDNPYTVNDLVSTLVSLNQRYDIGCIFIDYIQKVKNSEKSPTRQIELQKISGSLLESATTLSIPIILGCQVNREVQSLDDLNEDKLREAGDIEQDANIVMGIWNHAKETPSKDGMSIKVMKNREGKQPFTGSFTFNGPVLTIQEPETNTRW